MQAFLRFCVGEALAGRADQLKGYTIAVQVFDRDEDFDSAQDPIVRIQAGRLRRALERYYLVAGGEDPVVIDIPKGGYVPTFTRRPLSVSDAEPVEILAESSVPSIAVMPLDDLTPDTTQGYLAAGLAEELVSELTVAREPDYGPAWSALATLFCQMYVYDAAGFENPLATGLSYAQRGVSLEPGR